MNCQPFGFTGLAVTGAVWVSIAVFDTCRANMLTVWSTPISDEQFPVLLGLTMYQGRYFILGRSTTTGDINKVIYVDSEW